jgi:hypothetical protein
MRKRNVREVYMSGGNEWLRDFAAEAAWLRVVIGMVDQVRSAARSQLLWRLRNAIPECNRAAR